MTLRLYRDDPYLLDFEARVVARARHEGRPAVVLDRTAFYAESGGQPWDTGVLESGGRSVPVVAVVEHAGAVLHVLGSELEASDVRGRVDAGRRADHRQQHHGQHLLSRAFVETAGARTVSFHLGARECSIDLDREVTPPQVKAAVRRANEVVWQARPVSVRTVSRAEAEALDVAVPGEAAESVRLVEAQGFDLQACGGTHPRNTAEVGVVLALGHERYKSGARVRFVCGARAVALAEEHHGLLREAGALLSAGPESVPASVGRLLEQLAESGRRVRTLQAQVLEAEAQRLLAEARASGSEPAIVVRVLDGWNATLLRQLAGRLTEDAGCLALLASRSDTAHLAYARSEDVPYDVPALLQRTLQELGGRGGGRGRMAQGSCSRTEGLEEALHRAAAAAREAAPSRHGPSA